MWSVMPFKCKHGKNGPHFKNTIDSTHYYCLATDQLINGMENGSVPLQIGLAQPKFNKIFIIILLKVSSVR